MKKQYVLMLTLLLLQCAVFAQKLSIEDIRTVTFRNSGEIMDGTEVKGYFVYYVSDKVDKNTNAYTVEILDANLNKIKELKFEDDKNMQLAECSYNGSSILLLFANYIEKTVEHRVYNFDGKLIASYPKSYDEDMPFVGNFTSEAQNQCVTNIGKIGYTSIFNLIQPKLINYELHFFFTDRKKTWSYTGDAGDEYKCITAALLGMTDSLTFYMLYKKEKIMSSSYQIFVSCFNIFTGKKLFEMPLQDEKYYIVPTGVVQQPGKPQLTLIGNYYNLDDNFIKKAPIGLAAWTLDNKGKITAAKYNTWNGELAKSLGNTGNEKSDELGYIFIHRFIPMSNGKLYAIGEGYKINASALGIAANILTLGKAGNVAKFKITDLVMLEFDKDFNITSSKIYQKNYNTFSVSLYESHSPHLMALQAKALGNFDYNFTTVDNERTKFIAGYTDYVKEQGYKGMTFNTISYADGNFSNDKITLSCEATWMKILPGKPGSVLIMEYFKKQKKLDMRLEKIN